MLLRRITEHVKSQNWFAVALDLLIVFIGVFIGLQAQEWSKEVDRKSREKNYLNRLYSDVSRLKEARQIYDANREQTLVLAQTGLEALSRGRGSVDAEICTSIVATQFLTPPPSDLPTATELLAAGNLDLISSARIRTSLLQFLQQAEQAVSLIAVLGDDNRSLTRNYPGFFQLSYGPVPDYLLHAGGTWLNPTCDADEMLKNQAFLVDLTQNVFNYDNYTNRSIRPVSAALTALHTLLETELGFVQTSDGGTR